MKRNFFSAEIDKMALAKILQEKTGVRPVTLEDLYALSPTEVGAITNLATSHKMS